MTHYLDNSATTRVCPAAVDASVHAMTQCYGNPSSLHSMGVQAERLLTNARGRLALALDCDNKEIVFTSGGTEADNFAIFSAAAAGKKFGRHIITTAGEHAAVLQCVPRLREMGFSVSVLGLLSDGGFDFDAFIQALREDTILVSVMLVGNETGNLFPVRAVADHLKRTDSHALLHTDAVQGFLKMPVSPDSIGADLISVSSHKINGPKGAGALYYNRSRVSLRPLFFGGGQENGMRPGTENLPAIAGFGAACEEGFAQMQTRRAQMEDLKAYTLEQLGKIVPGTVILGRHEAPHILCLSLPGYRSEVLLRVLESENVYVSAGSACSRGKRSHVLQAMGLDAKTIDGALRVSFSHENTKQDTDALCSGLADAVKMLSSSGGRQFRRSR